MAHLRVHVHEMDCADEAALIRRALAPTTGIHRLDFDLIHGFVDVTFDEHTTSEAVLLGAIRNTGLAAHAVHGEDGRRVVASEHAHHDHHPHASTIATGVSGVLFLVAWIVDASSARSWVDIFVARDDVAGDPRTTVAYALSAAAGVWPLLPRAAAAIRHFRLDMHALVCLTVIGAAAIGAWSEGAAVAFLFGLAHRLEAWSIERARREIAALVGRGPAMVAHGAQPPVTVDALDGWGTSTGRVERWIERFAAVYTPLVTMAAAVVAIVPPVFDGAWSTWFYRALLFLVLACPCALVISTPVTLIAALSAAARRGVLVKGGAVLERAATVRAPTRQALRDAGIAVVGAHPLHDVDRADVVLTESDERAVVLLVEHARRAMRVVKQNVAIALVTKLAFLVSAPFGYAPLWMAVLADTGATIVVTVNGLRLLTTRE